MTRSAGRTYSLQEKGIPSWKRHALLTFVRHFCVDNFDEAAGLVFGANVADTESMPRSAAARRLHERYEVLNPNWREGFTLPILCSVDATLVYHTLRRMLRQALARR